MRTHHSLHDTHTHHAVDPEEGGGLSPEQLLSGIAMFIGFAFAMGLIYALVDALVFS